RQDSDLAGVAAQLISRTAFDHRAVVSADDIAQAREGLAALASGQEHRRLVTGHDTGHDGHLAFHFPGQGAQQPGVGRELAACYPVFADALDEVCAALDPHLERPLREILLALPGSAEASLIDETGYTQPALFAWEVAFYRLVTWAGVRPDVLIGHSLGELTAAHLAGVFDLADAARLIAARARLMQALPATGAMVALQASEEETLALIADHEEAVSLAAVNGPRATVISGDRDRVHELAEGWRERGRKATALRVSHAFHSPQLDPMLGDFRAVAESVTYHPPTIPVVSNVTGTLAGPELLTSARYWTDHVRGTVRYADGVHALDATTHLEVGPHTTLTALLGVLSPDSLAVPVHRKEQPEHHTLHTALARLHVHGHIVDWTAVNPATTPTPHPDLPTYPFQREHYWLPAGTGTTDLTAAGLDTAGHPLLGAAITLAGNAASIATSRLSVGRHPWLAEHRVFGANIVPGTGYLDLALDAGARVGCPVLAELTQEAPLTVPSDGAVDLQRVVSAPDADGLRTITFHTRPADEPDADWTRHATGILGPRAVAAPDDDLSVWPPVGAEPIDADELYPHLAAQGYEYGPLFQGVRAMWRDGDDLYGEIELPADAETAGFAIHPGLLDSALHPLLLTATGGAGAEATGGVRLPFAWTDVTLHGPAGRAVRVRLHPTGDDTLSVTTTDPRTGGLVVTIGRLTVRPVSPAQIAAAVRGVSNVRNSLFHIAWAAVAEGQEPPAADRVFITGEPGSGDDVLAYPFQAGEGGRTCASVAALRSALDDGVSAPDVLVVGLKPGEGGDPVGRTHVATASLTRLVQDWLGDERLVGSTLVVLTRRACRIVDEDGVPDLAASAAWGLLRSVQSEHPDRLLMVDLDEEPADTAVSTALAVREPQLALRRGVPYAPRLVRTPLPAEPSAASVTGTTLITGGTGALGRLLARHLAATTAGSHLLLVSRTGEAPELVAELTDLGAHVRAEACDVADRDALAALLDTLPAEHPLTAVYHTAGVLSDATITALDEDALHSVLAPKVDAAWNLHELTRAHPLDTFVLYSSAAGVLGSPGQANYAAANSFLDALAVHRHHQGLPATSIAWGLWATDSTLTGHLDATDRDRIGRSGFTPLSAEHAHDLLAHGLGSGQPALVAAQLNPVALRTAPHVPVLLRDLVPRPESSAPAQAPDALADRLAGQSAEQQQEILLEFVRTHIAAVLGHPDPGAIAPHQPFTELGFDSLTALEFRNRLTGHTGLALPATLVFDHPTPGGLAGLLRSRLASDVEKTAGSAVLDQLERLEAEMASDTADGADAGVVASRLRGLLARLERSRTTEASGGSESAAPPLESASVDELLSLIDNDLGRARTPTSDVRG
ncbi:SDR family NAD(P)-dependent oxidoreductase, partial [Streptomyces sp. NL15-2K]